MRKPNVAGLRPIAVSVQAGKTYLWCACGRSQRQPFCDSSHAGSGFGPVRYVAELTGLVFFCLCKQTGNRPFCDGAHKNLSLGPPSDLPAPLAKSGLQQPTE